VLLTHWLLDQFSAENVYLAAFTELRIVRISTEAYMEPEFDILPWLVQSLKEIASAAGDGASTLEEIAVHLDFGVIQEDDEVHMLQLQSSFWRDFDTLLTKSNKFPKLYKVDLYVCYPPDPHLLQKELGVEDIEQLFRGYMTGLVSKGLLHVQPTVLSLQRIVASSWYPDWTS
jgi:hypothetical protein